LLSWVSEINGDLGQKLDSLSLSLSLSIYIYIYIYINNSQTTKFRSQQGLTLGNSISLFLFVVIAEGLQVLLEVQLVWGCSRVSG